MKNRKNIYTSEEKKWIHDFYSLDNQESALRYWKMAGKCVELENIVLSEVAQTKKDKTQVFSLIFGL